MSNYELDEQFERTRFERIRDGKCVFQTYHVKFAKPPNMGNLMQLIRRPNKIRKYSFYANDETRTSWMRCQPQLRNDKYMIVVLCFMALKGKEKLLYFSYLYIFIKLIFKWHRIRWWFTT